MAQPYVGEIRIFAGNFAPAGWMFCSGQLLPISEYETLFQLIGTTYGGDGQSTFGLPDLRGRVPINFGNGFTLAETGGVETVTLTTNQIPSHPHPMLATNQGSSLSPANAMLASVTSSQAGANFYNTAAVASTTLVPSSMLATGGSQPHDNRQPYLGLSFIISLFGIFPSPT
jgi:microcystin-dependent protein